MNVPLRELRESKGFTQLEMAKMLGLKTVSAYSKKENGKTKISLQEAKTLSEKLDKPIDFFCP